MAPDPLVNGISKKKKVS